MARLAFVGVVREGVVDVPAEFEGKRVEVTLADPSLPLGWVTLPESDLLEDIGCIDMPPDEAIVVRVRVTEAEAV